MKRGRASPFGCRQNPWSGYRISKIAGMKVPVYIYGFQSALFSPSGVSLSHKALREEVRGLSQTVNDILARIGNLRARRQDAEQRGR